MNPTLNPDETTGEVRLTPRVVLGLAVMLAGLVLALDSLGFVEGGQIFRFWPLILVALGVVKWMSPVHQKMSALIWVVAGVAFLLHTLNRMSFGGVCSSSSGRTSPGRHCVPRPCRRTPLR